MTWRYDSTLTHGSFQLESRKSRCQIRLGSATHSQIPYNPPLTCVTLLPLTFVTPDPQTVEIPALKVTKKVKSLQMFRRPVERAVQGDRLGVCVTQFDPRTLERGLVAAVGYLPTIPACVVRLHRWERGNEGRRRNG